MKHTLSVVLGLAFLSVSSGFSEARADTMATVSIIPGSGAVTLTPRWSVENGPLGGFTFLSQDLGLGGGGGQFYSIKASAIPSGGDASAFTRYAALTGAASNHSDIGSKLSPDSYSALTSADPDLGFGAINLYMIHHRTTGDYLTSLAPSTAVASTVTDLKPMSSAGGPATPGDSGYFGLTFAAANLGYGANMFYYLRSDPLKGTTFGAVSAALVGSPVAEYALGISGHCALAFVGADIGFGVNRMYFLRLDPNTGYTILGTLHPGTGQASDIANLGSVFSTLSFFPADTGFAINQFYTTGTLNPGWQSISFSPIADRAIAAGSFTVRPSASSGLPVALSLAYGSVGAAAISGPVAGVFTVTPTAPGLVTLQATQAGQLAPSAVEYNMLRQSFTATGATLLAFTTQPQPQSQIAIVGSTASFTVAASGTSTTSYQWRKAGVAITGNPSALTAKLTLTHIQNSDAASYDVVATNATGSIVSNLVVLAVNAAPPIITNRPLTATGTVGNPFSFTITASSSPTRFSAVPLPPGLSLNSATGAITGVPTVVGPTSVTLGATGAGGTGNAILTLTVVAAFSPSVVQQPVRQTVAYGAGAAFSIAVAGNPAPTLQWQRLAAGSALWQNVVEGSGYQGVTSAILTVSSPTPSMSGDQFRAVITNSGGSTMSNPVALTVVGTEAKLLHFPAGLASDAAGNLYVANSASNTIDKISPGGVLSTLAGSSGVAGTLDGAGAGARFNQPGGITIDSTGTLFVADSGNGTIRRITPAGIVTTLAGSPFNRGNLDGLGGAASFGLPIGIAVDSLGNLYVADAFNATIRKITSAGSVSTFAGEPEKTGEIDGTGSAARFNYPCGVAVNATGIVYVADTYNHTLRKVTPAGVVTTFAGSAGVPGGNDGAGRDALFNQPVGLAVDINGNLYVADTGTGTIRLVSPNGAVITMAGTVDIAGLGDGPGGVAFFNQPRGITLDDRGYLAVADIYVADTGNALIRRITPDNVVSTLVLTKTIVSAPETGSETATPQDPEPRIIQKPKPVRGAPDPMDP